MEKEKIITSQNVHLYYGEKEALKGIDLDFPKNGIHALIMRTGEQRQVAFGDLAKCLK